MAIVDDIRAERRLLHDTLSALGPEAPTNVNGWQAEHLASHLAAQDRLRGVPVYAARTIVAATNIRASGMFLDRPALASLASAYGRPWKQSLDRLAQPPPSLLVRRNIAPITLWEYFVHHEDVRRANGGPRLEMPDLHPVLCWILRYNGRCLDRAVTIHTGQGPIRAGSGAPLAVSGDLADVVLWLSGRQPSRLETDGGDQELERLRVRMRS